MPTDQTTNFILVGLPQSGKSSFIAALWHVVETGELDDSLKVTALPADRAYLNGLRESWLKCKPVERNKVDHSTKITLDVVDQASKKQASFTFPDVSGEMYKLQFETRRLSMDYLNLLHTSSGLLLFIHPNDVKRPILISELNAVLPVSIEHNEAITKEWTHNDTPTQVVLVDLIQIALKEIKKPMKVAVIVSAWDLISNSLDEEYSHLTPSLWLQKELPLLFQYLNANETVFNCSIFGISAQGGQYSDDNSHLHNFTNQSERIKVSYEDGACHDISLPLKWILNV